MEMNKEMLEIIKKNLPQMTADSLVEVLDQAKKDAKEVVRLTRDLEQEREEYNECDGNLQTVTIERDSLKLQNEGWLEKQTYLEQREKAMDIALLNKDLLAWQVKSGTYQEVFNLIFKNPTVREVTVKNLATDGGEHIESRWSNGQEHQLVRKNGEVVQKVEDTKIIVKE